MTKDLQGWRKSHHSDPDGHCVEVGRAPDGMVGVRDTKLRGNGPTLSFTTEEWRTFLRRIQMDGH
ncbi:DUF397 domain-containing protein [Spirillospora sp. NPDC049024]